VALPRDPGGRPRPTLRRHASFPLPKPEVQRSAPPKRRPVLGPPAPRPKPVGVFAQPRPVPPTRTLQHAQRQAAQRTRRVAARVPQPVPYVPVIALRNQPRGYRQAVNRAAGAFVQRVHNNATTRAINDRQEGGDFNATYRQAVSEQLDALGPQARALFRAYLKANAPAVQRSLAANQRSLFQRSGGRFQRTQVELGGPRGYVVPTVQSVGGDPAWQAMVRGRRISPGPGGGSSLSSLASSLNPITRLPNFLAGPLATRVEQSGGSNLAGLLRLAREPQEIARTYAEHPETVKQDFGYVRDFLLGTAAIPYNLIRDPKGSVRSIPGAIAKAPRMLIEDEIARHKAAFQGNYGAFRKTVQQTGAIPYALDYATVGAGVAKGAGLLAKGGALGRRLEEFANTPRAQMRMAPGELRRQRDETRSAAPNLARLYYQRQRDARRGTALERRERKAQQRGAEFNRRGEPGQGNRRFNQPQAYPGAGPGKVRLSISQLAARRQAVEQVVERAGGKLHRDSRGRVESVRFTADRAASAHPAHFQRVSRRLEQMGFERRRVGGNLVFYAPKEVTRRSTFLENRGIRSIPAHLKGVAVNEIRGTTAEEAHAFQQAAGPSARALRVKGLSRHERAALFLAGTGRLPLDNPARARELLTNMERRIKQETGAKPRTRFETDTLKRIAYLKDHADEAFTPRLRQAVERIREQVRRGERQNPFLIPSQRVAARYGPASVDFGVDRGRVAGAAYDVRATEKSIARYQERTGPRVSARDRRRGMVAGEGTIRKRDAALRDEQATLNRRMATRSKDIDEIAKVARGMEREGKTGPAGYLRDRIRKLADENQTDWVRANAISREREHLDTRMTAMRETGAISGRPEQEAASVTWYHGTPMHFEGPPTAEGMASDLGVYLTSDPGYAAGYSGEVVKGKEARVMSMRVRPRKTLETRHGRANPQEHLAIIDGLQKMWRDELRAAEKRLAERHGRRITADAEARYKRDPTHRNRVDRENIARDAQIMASNELRGIVNSAYYGDIHKQLQGVRDKLAKGEPVSLQDWRSYDVNLRLFSSEIASLEAKGLGADIRSGYGTAHQPLKRLLQSLGYDSVRKVDIYADALVVLDEKLLGRRSRSDEVRQWLVDGAKRERGETTAEWVKRVRKAMEDNGIDHPPFFAPSEELRTPKFSIYTAGGARSPEPPKRRQYVLQRQGRERTDPEIIYEGIQRNHRTRISAQLVADVFDRVAHHRYRNMTTHELKKLAQKEGFDPSLYAVWYPKLYRDTLRNRLVGEMQGAASGAGRAATDVETAAGAQGGAFTHLADLLDPKSRDGAIVAADNMRDLHALLDSSRFKAERGTLIPRAAADELLSSTKETAAGRLMERLKTLQSRAVLGGLNINWVQADAVVNTLVATVLGGASPASFIQQRAFFRGLPPAVKDWAHEELDIGTSRSNVHIPRLGATVNNRFVNFFRFWRESPWGQRVRPIQRTINTFLKAERAIGNNPQRRALAYHLLRKEAFRQLDTDVGHMNAVFNRVASIFTGGAYTPESVRKQMLAIVHNKHEFEEIGRRTADILGDWTTFTALERKTLGRYFFFYPYLRYSMKLAFYTLPLDHPVRLAILANLANLNMDEQRKLIGGTDADTYLAAGRYFYRDAKGQMHEYNVRTFNPVGNVVTESQTSADLLQLMPPAFTIALGQIEKRDIYRGRDWRVKGTADRTAASDIGPLDGLLGTTRWRVLAKQLIELPPLTREIAKYMLPGEQGDDSLPFSPRPTVFKDPVRQAQADAKRQRDTTSLAGRFLRDQFRAFTSQPSDITDVLQRRHAHLTRRHRRAIPGGQRSGFGGSPTGSSTGSSSGWGGSGWRRHERVGRLMRTYPLRASKKPL
jgi:hypothetical protein